MFLGWLRRGKAAAKQTTEAWLGYTDADLYDGPAFTYAYRCRFCNKTVYGATYDEVFTENTAVRPKWRFAAHMTQILTLIWEERRPPIITHNCADGRRGLAELVGVIRLPEEEPKECPDAKSAKESSPNSEDSET